MGPVDVAIVGGGASGTLVAVQLLRQARGPWRIALGEGREIHARAAVLALGNLSGPDLAIPDGGLYASALYRRSPWERGALDGVPPEAEVLLLGSGLTMVDAALALQRRGHRGRILALSRHGLLPH